MKTNFKIKAFVHSLHDLAEVTILEENGNNHVVAEYRGKKFTAIFNIYNGLYYVDDIYGEIKE